MFGNTVDAAPPSPVDRLSVGDLRGLLVDLGAVSGAGVDDPGRIDLIGLLERVKGAAAAAQARVTVAFDASQRRAAAARGVSAAEQGKGVADQVALARRESPHRGAVHLGLAKALVGEMPCTLASLASGETSEWRATIMVRETAALSVEHRAVVDADLGPKLGQMGDRAVSTQARAAGYRLDPGSLIRRTSRAAAERCVTVRPAPATMTYLTGLLPVADGVAVYAALKAHAEAQRALGDTRSVGQLMADVLVARVTGRADGTAQDVEVQLVMTDRALFGGDHEPATLVGHGPVPAWLARRLVDQAPSAWVRRLFTTPDGARLVGADSRRRLFSTVERSVLVARDQWCRTPWCDAPIRHADHVQPYAQTGRTSIEDGQGLCEHCNYLKETHGWVSRVVPRARRHQVVVTTPTGHTYTSHAPPLPGDPGDRAHRLDTRRILATCLDSTYTRVA